jgi:hypothetical protein
MLATPTKTVVVTALEQEAARLSFSEHLVWLYA